MSCYPAATPSSVFELPSDSPSSRFNFHVTPVTGNCMTRSVTTAPIAIPGAKGSRTRSQRHTNFTPPRSYVSNVEKSMVRSKSAGSLSTAVSFLVAEHVHPNQAKGMFTKYRSEGALFYSPVDFTDPSDLNTLMQVWCIGEINRWIKQRTLTVALKP